MQRRKPGPEGCCSRQRLKATFGPYSNERAETAGKRRGFWEFHGRGLRGTWRIGLKYDAL